MKIKEKLKVLFTVKSAKKLLEIFINRSRCYLKDECSGSTQKPQQSQFIHNPKQNIYELFL